MKAVALALFALCFASTLASTVKVLTNSNFDAEIEKADVTLVEFYAPWCGHCKKLEPEYDAAAKELADVEGVALAKVDATEEKELGSKFEVRGYPTILVFRKGASTQAKYEGGRTAQAIVEYMKKAVQPAVSIIDSVEAFNTFSSDLKSMVVIAFTSADSELGTDFATIANSLRESFSFGLAPASLAAELDGAAESVVLYKPFDEKKNVYDSEVSIVDGLQSFLDANSIPLVDEIGPENYKKYMDRGIPLVWTFVDPSKTEVMESTMATLSAVAPDYKGKLSFVHLSGVQYGQMAQKLALSGEVFPSLVVESKGQKWVFPETNEFTTEAISEWLVKYSNGEIEKTVKSEPIPDEPKDDGVTIVVGKNFDEIVLDSTKDVLLEFYAPWCGHCKSLIPTYAALAKDLAGVEHIVIAKSDATANDYPEGFQVQGFPTIKFITAANEIKDYNGGRTKEDFLAYLRKEASKPIPDTLPVAGAEPEANDEL